MCPTACLSDPHMSRLCQWLQESGRVAGLGRGLFRDQGLAYKGLAYHFDSASLIDTQFRLRSLTFRLGKPN